jgi:hypothetical protein
MTSEYSQATAPNETPVPDAFDEVIGAMRVFCGMLLLSFAKHGQGLRDITIRNFIARGMVSTESIHRVWLGGSEQDAWILHRSLLDRLFHLHHLTEHDGFAAFDDFSFLKMFESRERLLADADMRAQVPDSLKKLQQKNRSRYNDLVARRFVWHRPKAEEIAKAMGLGFLYRHGYDYASMHVHPMAFDGEWDCECLIQPAHNQKKPDATVVRNTLLAQSMLMQEGLNASSLRWRAIVYTFIEQIRGFLKNGNQDFGLTLYKIGKVWPEWELCETSESPLRGDASGV